MDEGNMKKRFKECPMCTTVWESRDDFIADATLVLDGYQVNFDHLSLGLFYFTHNVTGCFTTMALPAGEFFDLNPVKPHTVRKTLSSECPKYCLHKNNLQKCPAVCECAFVRDVMSTVQRLKTDLVIPEALVNLAKQPI